MIKFKRHLPFCLSALFACAGAFPSFAQAEDSHGNHSAIGHMGDKTHKHISVPSGVMGSHIPGKKKCMASYRFNSMSMNNDHLSPENIATTAPNIYFGKKGQPPTLRVVPVDMQMNMHMMGAMCGVTDNFTLGVMGKYGSKTMDHITFAGGKGTKRLGSFTTESKGLGDTSVVGLYQFFRNETHRFNFGFGLSVPTGSITKEDKVLTPMGKTPTLRLPYAMQMGSGTWDLLPSLTYVGQAGDFGWGGQYTANVRTGENSEGYTLGDKHAFTGWGAYRINDWLSTNFSLKAERVGKIRGQDSQIVAPVQTADPDNYGGQFLDMELGLDISPKILSDKLPGNISLKFGAPLHQDVNGLQMRRGISAGIGFSLSF